MRFISQCLMFILGVLLILGVSINRLLIAAIQTVEREQGGISWQMRDISHHINRADEALMEWERSR